jgi:uncharacterized protein (DUF1697 family)
VKASAQVTYVALLRGINVGGKNVIPMAALSRTFEGIGLSSVQTYIQSGNVLFQTADSDPRALETRVERALTKAHRYDAKVVVRSLEEMAGVVDGVPRAWKRADPTMRYNVLFLRHEIDTEEILDGLTPKSSIEQVSYRPGVLYWSAHTSDLGQTSMVKLSSKAIYRQLTVRNLNTTKKIFQLMKALPGA